MSTNFNRVIDRSDAGSLIPVETSNEIIDSMPAASAALSLFRQMRMSRKQKSMPVISALPYAYFVNGDTGLKRTTQLGWDGLNLVAEELACIVPIPEAVLDDSEYDIWGECKPKIAEAMGAALDAAVFFGINKPDTWAASILTGAVAAGNTFTRGSVAGQKLDLDINSVMMLVEEDGFDVNGFVARKRIKGGLRGLRTNDGALLFQGALQAGAPDTVYNEPIFYGQNEAWADDVADLFTGDFTKGIIGIRQDITYKVLDQAVITDDSGNIIFNLAQQDMVALRCVFRCAWQKANPANRQKMSASGRDPFAVLRPVGFVG